MYTTMTMHISKCLLQRYAPRWHLSSLPAHEVYQGARLRAKHNKPAAEIDNSDSESIDDDSIPDEELGFETPLDTVDPYVTFKRALTGEQLSATCSSEDH